jgi:hypothetical protein
MSCPICLSNQINIFNAEVLKKYQAQYKVCYECGYLQADKPHWLSEAYLLPIADADTGVMTRNNLLANKISRILFWLGDHQPDSRYLDVAGGYGCLTRLMRDFGFNFFWTDKYCQNLFANGFEYNKTIGKCNAITAIEVMEHVIDPKLFIKDALNHSGASMLIFTTELYEGDPPDPTSWWYYTFTTGQHIGFFQQKTFKRIALDMDLHFVTANGIHILSRKKINQFLLNILTNRYLSIFPAFLIQRFLGSKTYEDHLKIMQKND